MTGDGYRVGVLGATGLVGTTILDLLASREFPLSQVVPFASERSAGKAIEWGEEELEVQALSEDSIQGLDIVLSSAGGAVSAEWTPKLVEAGAVVVDNTSYWRMHDDVPLVVAEVNPDDLAGHRGIVANPNCSTMQMVVALKPLHDAAGIERLVISTYQAVSGTGKAAIDELREQSRAVLDGGDPEASVYPHPIAFNALPQAGQLRRRRRPHRRGAQADRRDSQDPRRSGDPRQRDLRAGAGRHRPLRGGQRRDPRAARARARPRAARRGAGRDRARRPGRRALPDGDRGRGPRRRLRRPHPPRPRQRAGARPLGRLRQPAQGRRDQHRPDRRAARSSATCSASCRNPRRSRRGGRPARRRSRAG